MRLSSKAIAACALLSFSPLCLAEAYVEAGGLMSTYKYDNVNRGFGPQVAIGYRAETIPMMFELGYLATGKNNVNNPITLYDTSGASLTIYNPSLSFSGETASIGYLGRFDSNGSTFYGKIGYYTGKSKFEGTDSSNTAHGSVSETSNGFTYGFGLDWMFTRNFGLRFDISSLVNAKAIPYTDEKSSVTTFGIGAVFAFGSSEPSNAPSYPRVVSPEVAPVYYPAAVAAPAAPVVAPPVSPAPASVGSPAVATAVAGAVIRGQASASSSVAGTLKNGGSVRLLSQRIDNAEGAWWFVVSDNIQGWINDKDLQH